MDQAPLILIVDDEPMFLEIFSTKLTASGFRTAKAQGSAEGLAEIRSLHPDLVLLDMQMPVQTGADMLAEVKNDPSIKDTAVVFLSNLGGTDPASREVNEKFAREAGAKGYIYKSEDADAVVEKVRAFLKA